MINIIGVGDIMPGGILSGKTDGYLSSELITVMKSADIRVGTLETAVGNSPTFYDEKMARDGDVIYVKDKDLSKLKDLDINIVSLANNHFFDLGEEGAKHTIQMLDSLGIKHIGAGNNIEEASRAVIENIHGETVAFIGFCDYEERHVGWCPYATNDKPGVNPMYESHVESEIRRYKSICDYVVVMPHWGKEHTYTTTLQTYKAAKAMIKAGADLILGSHPHRVQPVVNFQRASVAYSLGNFLFPNRLLVPPRSTYYSETEIDITSLPTTDGYPIVEELTYKKWKPLAMIGMIADAKLSKKQTISKFHLTIISEKGKLSLYNNRKINCILQYHKLLMMYTPYSAYYFLYRNAARAKRLLTRATSKILKKLKF